MISTKVSFWETNFPLCRQLILLLGKAAHILKTGHHCYSIRIGIKPSSARKTNDRESKSWPSLRGKWFKADFTHITGVCWAFPCHLSNYDNPKNHVFESQLFLTNPGNHRSVRSHSLSRVPHLLNRDNNSTDLTGVSQRPMSYYNRALSA